MIPFNPDLKSTVEKDVEDFDLALFAQCVDDAIHAFFYECKVPTRRRRRSVVNATMSNGGQDTKNVSDTKEETTAPQDVILSRQRRVPRNETAKTMDTTGPSQSTPSPSTPSHSKRVHFSEQLEFFEPTKAGEKDKTSEGTVPVRRRSIRKLDATTKRKRCLQITTKTHEADDLSVFIAHQYYSYLEDGKTPLDALILVAQKWEMKRDAVMEHLDAYEFECMFHLYLSLFHFILFITTQLKNLHLLLPITAGKPPNKRVRT
ncbi:hypothetical protein RFI_37850 [Reticulomyxa filosa]|uniref:Uncharacterized protein n=1 Tax=Reticulomyxa filosa TaxID=46433 RepID=X6LE14_RETFI|nr:hypothetical protein RFI_37850 [Reticulomyxa filosa]|eukprot:ETN99620.1 hypothetical protein RFI_37850 [Reticulomyxa filosa]